MNAKKLIFWNRKNGFSGSICLAICAGILLVGLWPFDFRPQNKVEWLPDRNGIRFYGQGMAYNPEPLNITERNSLRKRSISIELWLRPQIEPGRSVPSILSFYDDRQSETCFIGQWKSSLILRRSAPSQTSLGNRREVGLLNALPAGHLIFTTITMGEKGTSIYLDGRLAGVYPYYSFISGNRNIPGQFVLGNSSTGNSFWSGDVMGLAIYDLELTPERVLDHVQRWVQGRVSTLSLEEGLVALYPFTERSGMWAYNLFNRNHLRIPSEFKVLRKTILALPKKESWLSVSSLKDATINIMGFIPFGYFLFAYVRRTKARARYAPYLYVLMLGGLVSLNVELIQVYLPTRTSSLSDLLFNILGTALGAVLSSRITAKPPVP
jgi:VanZ family protein